MKGIVFTEFIEMVEDRFSPDTADQIIEDSDLDSGGAYTRIGTYDYHEMLQLIGHLSEQTGIAADELTRVFGEYMFGRFVDLYPHFFQGIDSALDFLANVHDYIHVEVRKLYPDAELPAFEYDKSQPGKLIMIYRSSRPFAHLADGLLHGCLAHFGQEMNVTREDLTDDLTSARFTIVQAN